MFLFVSSPGHTSNADGLWGGVPVLTLQGERMGTRITSSLLRSLSGWKEGEKGEEKKGEEKKGEEEVGLRGLLGLITRDMKVIF